MALVRAGEPLQTAVKSSDCPYKRGSLEPFAVFLPVLFFGPVDPIVPLDPVGQSVELLGYPRDVARGPLGYLDIGIGPHLIESFFNCGTYPADLLEVVLLRFACGLGLANL